MMGSIGPTPTQPMHHALLPRYCRRSYFGLFQFHPSGERRFEVRGRCTQLNRVSQLAALAGGSDFVRERKQRVTSAGCCAGGQGSDYPGMARPL